MAEEDTSDSMITPERLIKSDTCGSASDGFTVSMKTVGTISPADSLTKVLSQELVSHATSYNVASRYMRPSNGSCHDMCKYGRKHTFEEKPWKVGRKPARDDSANVLANLGKEKFVNHCSEKVKPSPKVNSSRQTDRRHSLEQNCHDAKTHLAKSRIIPDAQAQFGFWTRSNEKKYASPEPPEIIKSVCFPSEIVEVPMEQGSSVDINLPMEENGKTCLPKMHSTALKSKAAIAKLSCSFESSDGTLGKGRKMPEHDRRQTEPLDKVFVKQVVDPLVQDVVSGRSKNLGKSSSFKLRKVGHLKLTSSLKDHIRVPRVKTGTSTSEKVIHKTLHVISIETEERTVKVPDNYVRSSPSVSTKNKDARLSDREAKVFGKKEALKAKVPPPTKENKSKTLKKGRVTVSEDAANGFPVKLKFKSGKVLDHQSDAATPRRLQFRRPRLQVNEGSKIDLREEVSLNATFSDAALVEEISSSQKIVLKHQDVQDKKDVQGLLNNVIEETASKLVVTRKSKVKALVGAFETVISLQETKPS